MSVQGLSGEVLEREGHAWIGCDISTDMLQIASERDNEGDMFALDIGEGLPFRCAAELYGRCSLAHCSSVAARAASMAQ